MGAQGGEQGVDIARLPSSVEGQAALGSGRMVCRRYRSRYPVCELRSWYRGSYQLRPGCVYAVLSIVPCTQVE